MNITEKQKMDEMLNKLDYSNVAEWTKEFRDLFNIRCKIVETIVWDKQKEEGVK